MSAALCEGCGRLGGETEVYCPACGRPLPGRVAEPSEVTPPGWLVASGRGAAASLFEPLPTVAVAPAADPLAPARTARGWSVRASARVEVEEPAADEAVAGEEPAAGAGGAPAAVSNRTAEAVAATDAATPRLRVLYGPLLAVILLSSTTAVVLLVLHVLGKG